MVEEVFKMKLNSQIYLNDHLTPYFNNLYLIARTAKRDGKLASATSHGGKIRARKNANDAPIVITSENQLQTLIEMESGDSSIDSIQPVDDAHNVHHTKKNEEPSNTSNSSRTRQRRVNTNRADY